jgi:hypothetical protein
MALERGKRGEIPSDLYNKAYAELVTIINRIPANEDIALKDIAEKKHKYLMDILEAFPESKVHDLSGQPVLNTMGV